MEPRKVTTFREDVLMNTENTNVQFAEDGAIIIGDIWVYGGIPIEWIDPDFQFVESDG